MVERFRQQPEGPAGEARPRIPGALPVLPLPDTVLFPYSGVPLIVNDERAIALIDDAMHGSRMVALVATKRHPEGEQPPEGEQRPEGKQRPGPDDLYRVGTA